MLENGVPPLIEAGSWKEGRMGARQVLGQEVEEVTVSGHIFLVE